MSPVSPAPAPSATAPSGEGVGIDQPVNDAWEEYDPDLDGDGDDEEDREADCGRWINGRLSHQCRLAGSEWCDWECPIGLGAISDARGSHD